MIFDVKQLDLFPSDAGVYLMKNSAKEIIYVGKAKDLKKRVKQYFSATRDERPMIPFLIAEIATIDTIVVPTEKEALLLENTLIKKHQPKFNACLKDDKTFVSLMINIKHPWPMIRLMRYKGKPKEKGLYFGPYTSAYAARQSFELLTTLFPLRQCSDSELQRRKRPCLLYSIKRCIAPCAGLCTREQYDEFVNAAIKFLKGQDKEILDQLQRDMQHASDNLEFEKAASLLNTIQQIQHVIHSRQIVAKPTGKDSDVLALFRQAKEAILMQLFFREGKLVGSEHYSFSEVLEEDIELIESFILQYYKTTKDLPHEILLPFALKNSALIEEILHENHQKKIFIHYPKKGDKKKLVDIAEKNAAATFQQEKDHQQMREQMLLDLCETLKLNRYPKRIECFDTSNISGSDLVACMIAFTDAERDKARTRYFKIRGIKKSDDYGALHQTLSRRLLRAKEEDDLPDLLIIDGGKGQLNIALEVLKELDIANVDCIALAKEEARHDRGLTLERVFIAEEKEPIILARNSPLLFLLQKIRDETHRAAIQFHRSVRTKRVIHSELENIAGIGKIKQKRLLQQFGSLKRVKEATEEQLLQVPGITRKDIENIKKNASDPKT